MWIVYVLNICDRKNRGAKESLVATSLIIVSGFIYTWSSNNKNRYFDFHAKNVILWLIYPMPTDDMNSFCYWYPKSNVREVCKYSLTKMATKKTFKKNKHIYVVFSWHNQFCTFHSYELSDADIRSHIPLPDSSARLGTFKEKNSDLILRGACPEGAFRLPQLWHLSW